MAVDVHRSEVRRGSTKGFTTARATTTDRIPAGQLVSRAPSPGRSGLDARQPLGALRGRYEAKSPGFKVIQRVA
jgi:hypothetical protein